MANYIIKEHKSDLNSLGYWLSGPGILSDPGYFFKDEEEAKKIGRWLERAYNAGITKKGEQNVL